MIYNKSNMIHSYEFYSNMDTILKQINEFYYALCYRLFTYHLKNGLKYKNNPFYYFNHNQKNNMKKNYLTKTDFLHRNNWNEEKISRFFPFPSLYRFYSFFHDNITEYISVSLYSTTLIQNIEQKSKIFYNLLNEKGIPKLKENELQSLFQPILTDLVSCYSYYYAFEDTIDLSYFKEFITSYSIFFFFE